MTGSESYEVIRTTRFNTSYEQLLKTHYRKDKKKRAEFENLVLGFLEELQQNPRPEGTNLEPCPNNVAEEGFEFRKKRWKSLPGLNGSARFGRLLYVISTFQNRIYAFWIYTHKEFSEPKGRPPEKELANEIRAIKRENSEPENTTDKEIASTVAFEVDT